MERPRYRDYNTRDFKTGKFEDDQEKYIDYLESELDELKSELCDGCYMNLVDENTK